MEITKSSKVKKAYVAGHYLEGKNIRNLHIGISIGNQQQRGDYLEATIAYANRNFDYCLINIADTSQRHNLMMENREESAAYSEALSWGDQWLFDNLRYIEKLSIPYKVTRWDHWRLHPDFPEVLEGYYNLYENNSSFQELAHLDLARFTDAHLDKLNHLLTREELERRCVNYLLEELSVWTIMGRSGKYLKAYPAKPFKTVLALSSQKYDAPQGIENIVFARINFNK
ncbi:tRNA-dependent cyclodipeptide synthase [Persicobacter sp. CCB-QB2]|uniref:tRNA-dependent cyclodipeptide synthase n=1 Tax=Persicobacter sp. CCB-QB2 TaxID=1561025 RepID=UPI0006A944A2|nr:tRNA-dependent cyclodipeptide synthase [Persicobacter sp. CCB-QB2]